VHLVYDSTTNRFLPGNRVVLTDRATKCLTSFSLDFERRSANTSAGPDMRVRSVSVNGLPARWRFVQPTYPGDPNGQNDPNPAAHEASEANPVGGPRHNPLPPACSPELLGGAKKNSLNGTPCPANKLVITPPAPLPHGARFTVRISYTGRPGVHNDGDATTEGWFRARSGGFVTTEPVGSEDWIPLNDYPAAKPTYDFADTVTAGRTVVANGVLVSVRHHRADAEFPGGSVTWRWHASAPIASYLVEDSIGNYLLTERTVRGKRVYTAQDASISAAQRRKNLAIMRMQPDITRFESRFTGPYPFTSEGIIVGTPSASFEEEMQTMIAFAGGTIDTDTLYHENMHQWWGDNVTEDGYRMTFFKEGMATFAEFLYQARLAENAAGGPSTPAGRAAFQASLVHQFNAIYGLGGSFWTAAPSNPDPWGLFSGSATYYRPVPPTSRCARSSATPTSPGPSSRSSAPTVRPASANASSRPPSAAGCPSRPRQPGPGCAGSSPSGSTRPMPRAAERTGPRSPVRVSPAPASRRRARGCGRRLAHRRGAGGGNAGRSSSSRGKPPLDEARANGARPPAERRCDSVRSISLAVKSL